jgi:colanic acid biosynthesis glycosyl transferase WcaI
MRIGVVSQYYPPEPAFIPASLAEELAARGHEVLVLTAYPNYPRGRIYPHFERRSHEGGVAVRRVPLYPSHDRSLLRRGATYLSFAFTSTAAALSYLSTVDVVYVYHPPPTAFAAAALLRALRGIPAVLHVQDVWPEALELGPLSSRAVGAVMRWTYRAAAGVAVSSPSMRDLVVAQCRRAGADATRVRTILNWTDESLFRPVPATAEARAAIGYRGRCTVMHAGNIGPFQNIAGAVRAAAAAQDEVDLVLVGSGIEEAAVRRVATQFGAANVRFVGRRDPGDMAALYAAADYQLISLCDRPGLRAAIPSKLQAALSCGSPVLVAAAGDCARLVTDCGAGLTCPPGNWPALAEGFLAAAALPPAEREDMGRRARQSYRAQMSQRAGVDQLEDMLIEAAKS